MGVEAVSVVDTAPRTGWSLVARPVVRPAAKCGFDPVAQGDRASCADDVVTVEDGDPPPGVDVGEDPHVGVVPAQLVERGDQVGRCSCGHGGRLME